MRILIVGAGIASLTLAALLKQRGLVPTLVEKAPSFGHAGYMLGLFPFGSNVLYGLNAHEDYLNTSVPLDIYEAYTMEGKLLKKFPLKEFAYKYKYYQGITRYDLLDVLYRRCENLPIHFNTEVESLEQIENHVTVKLSDGSIQEYDLVVGADGMHSKIRSLILAPEEVQHFETGWGGWVWWSAENIQPQGTIREYWGVDSFLGSYPVKGKIGNIAAVPFKTPEAALQAKSRSAFIKNTFLWIEKNAPEIFSQLPEDNEAMFFWTLSDVRSKTWFKNRVALVGDAAAAFLPTAGIGASMAMESAAVLDDILSRTDAPFIPLALAHYEKRRKKRVESVQQNSRDLAKLMMVKGSFKSKFRNFLTKITPAKYFVSSIIKAYQDPI